MEPTWTSDCGTARLWLGDCLEVMASWPDGAVDAVVTDPPYCSGGYLEAQKNTKAQGLRGATVAADGFKWFRNDSMGTQGLAYLLRGMMSRASRFLAMNRGAYVFCDWRMLQTLAPCMESGGLRFRNLLVWDKGNAGLGVGFKPAHELIMEFANGSTEYHTSVGQNVLRHCRVHATQKDHNAQKPIELIQSIVEVPTIKGQTIADPFMGSGTTGVAAVRLGRQFWGVEIDEHYFEIAKRRIQDELRRAAFLEGRASGPRQTMLPMEASCDAQS